MSRQGSGILNIFDGIITSVVATPPDVTGPITAIVSQTVTKVSRITGKNVLGVTFHGDEMWQQYQVRIVATDTDDVTMGTLVQSGPNDQSFETDATPAAAGWIVGASPANKPPTISFSNAWSTVGVRSLHMVSNGAITFAANNFQQALAPKMAIAPGQSVTVVVDTFSDPAINTGPMLQITLNFFNAANAFLAQALTNVGVGAGEKLDQIVSAVAPANAASFQFGFTLNGAPASGAAELSQGDAWIDNLRVEFPANQDFTATITEAALEAAAAAEGNNLLKVFLQDVAGNWST
jgi:hypothetical protein